jgi:hypothetical protein
MTSRGWVHVSVIITEENSSEQSKQARQEQSLRIGRVARLELDCSR